MSDAKQLDPAPATSLPKEPQLFEAEAAAANEPSVDAMSSEAMNSDAMSDAISGQATLLNVRTPKAAEQGARMRRLTGYLLGFFLLGLVMFGLGVGVAFALVTGVLDAHTAQLKELVQHAKDLLHAAGK